MTVGYKKRISCEFYYKHLERFDFAAVPKAKATVRTALAVQEKNALNHTPFNCHIGARINKNAIGNTSVPKNEVSNERTGRSIDVKNDEKHISTQPVI